MADTPPSLTGLTLSTYNIDLSGGPIQLTFSGTATDDVGINDLSIEFTSLDGPNNFLGGTESIFDAFNSHWVRTQGSEFQNSATETVETSEHDGHYVISRVVLFDNGPGFHQVSYTQAQLQALGIRTDFTVSHADNTGPSLTALNLPVSVEAGHALSITASASDPSGVQRVVIEFDKNIVAGGTQFDIFGNTDSWADGTSTSTETVPAPTADGVYTIKDIILTDNNNNTTTLTTAQLAQAGFRTTVTVNHGDRTPPVLTGLTFPTSVDVTAGAKPITFSATATDDNSGIFDVVVHFDKDVFAGANTTTQFDINGGNGDSWTDGASARPGTVLQSVPTGDYHITSVDVTDNAGNKATYTPAELQAKGIATTIHVNSATHPADHTAPVLNSITLPNAVDVTHGSANFPINIVATDQTGIKDVTIYFDHNVYVSTGATPGFIFTGASDSWSDGQSGGNAVFTHQTPQGLYEIDHVVLRDILGNSITYTHNQLGAHSAFYVINSSLGVTPGAVLIGTPGNDTLTGTPANNILEGLEGNDTLTCGGGSDILEGGKGNDTYRIISTTDRVIEVVGEGTDTVAIGVSYVLAAHLSIEIFETLNASLSISLNLTGNEIANTIYGNQGINIINGGAGADTMTGYGGSDSYYVDNVHDVVHEVSGAGSDRVYTSVGYTLTASQSIEFFFTTNVSSRTAINLTGNSFGQTIYGNAGNNIINGLGGADLMYGFGGNDSYYVDNAGDHVYEAVSAGSDRVYTSISFTLAASQSIELFLAANAASTLAINLTGNDFAQTIYGDAGKNIINGKGGADLMYGLGGNDTYYVDNAGDHVYEAVGFGSDRVYTSVSYTLGASQSIELLLTTAATATTALHLTGNNLAQTIYGNAGNNIIDGKGGADLMYGLGGNDTYYVDNAGDHVYEAIGFGSDRVLTSVSYTLGAGQCIELFMTTNVAGTAALNLTGNDLAQTIYGNAGNNIIDGKGGGDAMWGFGGNDTYIVDSQSDAVHEAVGGGSDRVKASVTYVLAAGTEVEQLTTTNAAGTANISLIANEFNNTVAGNEGDNFIDGAAGNDLLYGFGGHDTFVFNTALNASTNVDTIVDFNPSLDRIQLENAVFTAFADPVSPASQYDLPGLNFYSAAGATSAHLPTDRIIYDSNSGNLYYDADGSLGGSSPILFATLLGHPALSSSNFFVS